MALWTSVSVFLTPNSLASLFLHRVESYKCWREVSGFFLEAVLDAWSCFSFPALEGME